MTQPRDTQAARLAWLALIGAALTAALVLLPLSDPPEADDPTDGFTLAVFPIGLPGVHAYNAAMISALDHSGRFYSRCCDTTITAYTGETVMRGESALGCPVAPTELECFFEGSCICAYQAPEGEPFVINGNYTGGIFGSGYLLYDGHAGYDYDYGAGTPLVATKSGMLCKPLVDEINGNGLLGSPWESFRTFYIDHGTSGETGYASWYLHAQRLDGDDMNGTPLADLEVGQCAPVAAGQLVARVGNTGTFLPHLHFEVRIHDPLFGPEDGPAVIDPYGFTGEGDDPWLHPNSNIQAVSRLVPVWVPEPSSRWLAAGALATLATLRATRRRYSTYPRLRSMSSSADPTPS